MSNQSLNGFLLARLREIADRPTVPELVERIRSRGSYAGRSSASVIRSARAGR